MFFEQESYNFGENLLLYIENDKFIYATKIKKHTFNVCNGSERCGCGYLTNLLAAVKLSA